MIKPRKLLIILYCALFTCIQAMEQQLTMEEKCLELLDLSESDLIEIEKSLDLIETKEPIELILKEAIDNHVQLYTEPSYNTQGPLAVQKGYPPTKKTGQPIRPQKHNSNNPTTCARCVIQRIHLLQLKKITLGDFGCHIMQNNNTCKKHIKEKHPSTITCCGCSLIISTAYTNKELLRHLMGDMSFAIEDKCDKDRIEKNTNSAIHRMYQQSQIDKLCDSGKAPALSDFAKELLASNNDQSHTGDNSKSRVFLKMKELRAYLLSLENQNR